MAWTHYTAPLAPGEELTSAMIAEVLAALDERLVAVDADWGVESAGAEEIALRGSGLVTRRVYFTGPASTSGGGEVTNTLAALDVVVVRLSRFYLRPDPIETNTGTSGAWNAATSEVLTAALVSLGEAVTTPGSWTGGDTDTRVYWNMIRAAVQMLRWVQLVSTSPAPTDRDSFTPALPFPRSQADAKAAWLSTAPFAFSGSFLAAHAAMRYDYPEDGPAYDYRVNSQAVEASVEVPTSSAWGAGWALAMRLTCAPHPGWASVGGDLSAEAFVLALGGEEQSYAPAGAGTAWVAGPEGITATGAQTIALRSSVEDDVDVFDAIWAEAVTDTGSTGGGGPARIASASLAQPAGAWLAGRPGWAYP